jgi:anaerobic selenocysteine-containing dehydrogenase
MGAVHHRTCNLCEAMCGLAIEHEGERVLGVRGDPEDPFSRGYLCPKALALVDVWADPDRLRGPLVRRGERFEPIAWPDALDQAAARITAIQERHGRDAVAVYVGNPTAHNMGSLLFGPLFLLSLGTKNRYSATSCDQLPHMLAALCMFGHQLLMPVPDIDRTSFLLALGANPIVSNGSIMSAPNVKKRLRALGRRGGRLVVVDPRRTETAALADEHLFIRPGTDALLLAALVRTVFEQGLLRLGRLAAFTDGLERLRALVEPFAPERVAGATGIDAPRIRALARAFASAESAVCYGRVGTCTQAFGGLCQWLVNALNVVTGNLDRAGGAMFTTPAADIVVGATRIGMRGWFDRYRSRVRGLPDFGGELPAAVLAEEIETPGPGQIRALVTLAGNPVLSTPNGARLARALGRLELMVSIDIYRNETTRHAHYLLPPVAQLEQGHYDVALYAYAVRNIAKYSPPMFPKPSGALADWEIELGLTERLLGARGGAWRALAPVGARLLRRLGPEGVLDLLLRTGPHRLDLAKLRAAPHGLDLGPLAPRLPERLGPPGRIDVAPARITADLPRLVRSLGDAHDGLRLIGRRQLRTNNSWMHNSERLAKGADRCTLLMHPLDARERGLDDGARVRLRSRAGEVVVPLQITEHVMRGVVSLPHGFGHDQPGVALRVARARQPGASINDVTDELAVDALSGTSQLSGIPVEVSAASAEAAP